MVAAANDLIGTLVDGRYQVLEAMASGSMGAVFLAERVPVGKRVAIKFLHATFKGDSEFQTRFERETQVMSKLAHPNCVSVVDFGEWDGAPYIVMEFVDGRTLRDMLDDGPLEPHRALAIARQLAAGLAHAHSHGITHRDVKPANIMITQELTSGDHVRILDFGLARLRGGGGRDATQTNVVVGTPNYMAPEQTVGGGTIDARTDIYAVGIVLFEMIAGDRPFQAEDTMALLGMHRAAPIPRLADRVPEGLELPAGIQLVIETALAKSPDDRYQSAVELAEAIDSLVGARVTGPQAAQPSAPIIAPVKKSDGTAALAETLVKIDTSKITRLPVPHKSKNHLGILLAGIVLLAGIAVAWKLTHRGSSAAAPAPQVATVPSPDAPINAIIEIDAAPPPPPPDAALDVDAMPTVPESPDGGVPDEIEMDPDPTIVANDSPDQGDKAEDEAEDAPKTDDEAEQRVVPPKEELAKTLAGAKTLIQQGAPKRDLAIRSLRALWQKSPNSSYIPYLLANLYFDRQWWGIAMEHYGKAIRKNGGYKRNPTLINNVIRMLASKRTINPASTFLVKTIGKAAKPALLRAAKSDQHPGIRKQAAALARRLR